LSKKKLWIILSAIIAVCVIAAAVLICVFVFGDGNSSGSGGNGGGGTEDNDIQYDFDIKGTVGLLLVDQTAKLPQSASFTSENTSVAKVDANGVVTAVGIGETVIVAKCSDGSEIRYTILVAATLHEAEFSVPETTKAAFVCADGCIVVGEYAAVPVYLVNNPGVSGFSLHLSYDSRLFTVKAVGPASDGVDSLQFTDDSEGNLHIMGLSHVINGIKEEENALFYLYFATNEGKSTGSSELTLSMEAGDMLVSVENGSEVTVDAEVYHGSIQTVK